ncbi:hypothetical protein ACEPAI_1517 [Sanghuangporus weigelae]
MPDSPRANARFSPLLPHTHPRSDPEQTQSASVQTLVADTRADNTGTDTDTDRDLGLMYKMPPSASFSSPPMPSTSSKSDSNEGSERLGVRRRSYTMSESSNQADIEH